ncbi:Mitochondrial carrier family protein [Candida albicans]|uniref:Mitochondrial thiamine pyrophosphate carrier 1 n=1 Tax=Candida albicans TaxID=5476 RepID=A0A8H6F112_CANAX|nr:Mitochondrial carrier family protein [Candida albicans]
MSNDPTPILDNAKDSSQVPDFSDIVQGEDLEFRQSKAPTFPVVHKIEKLGEIPPPTILSRLSNNQLITIAGAASGFLAGIVVCPLDVVKTRLQAQGTVGENLKYNGFLGTFKTILREEGIRGLYRGLVPTMIGYLPTWTIYFTFNCSKSDSGCENSINGTNWERGQQVYYRGTFDAFKKMYQHEGLKVFYSGLIPSLFGLLHVGIHFPVYEKLKSLLHCNLLSNDSGSNGVLWRLIAASSFSKMVASTVTYPHEILRTRMQLRRDKGKSKSLVKTVSSIFQKDGLRGFYSGYFTNLARTLPASAVTLVSFEYFKTYLLEINGRLKSKFTH